MKLGITRLIGAGFVLAGGGPLWLVWDEIFLDVGERSYAGGEALATAVGILMPGVVFLIFGEGLWSFYSVKRATKRDLAIIVAGIAVVVVIPLVVFNWTSLFGGGARVEADAEAGDEAEPKALAIDAETRNFLEETARERREAELSIRRATDVTARKDSANPAQLPKP